MSRLIKKLHRLEDALLAMFLFMLIVLACLQIGLRNLADTGLSWADPTLRVMVLWIGLLGALAASRSNNHISIDLLSRFVEGRSLALVQATTSLFTSFVCGLLAVYAFRFLWFEFEAQATAFAGIPAWILESIIPIVFTLISLRYFLLFIQSISNVISDDTE
ncbi:TRAP transporter small permease [Pseudomonadota bacterium]